MKRKLIRQMLNQWRSNIWMLVQLLIVSCAIFYMCTGLYFNIHNYFLPFGYQTDNTYQITLAQVPEGGEGYVPDLSHEQTAEDIMTIIQRLKSMDAVENVAYSRWAGPYLGNYSGMGFSGVAGNDSIWIGGNLKKVSPEYIELFGIESADGTTQQQLMQMLSEGKLLASKEVVDKDQNKGRTLPSPSKLKDYTFHNGYVASDSLEYRIGAIVESTKRFDYDNILPVIYQIWEPQNIKWTGLPEISVRIKPNADGKKFVQEVRDKTTTFLCAGNVYVQNVQPYERIKEQANAMYNKEVIYSIVCIMFLLVNIFLGLFGVFWFRTRQRTAEIALRRSFGATSGSIYRRLVSEGLLLLLITLPFAALVDCLLASNGLTCDRQINYFGVNAYVDRWAISVAATAIVMAIMIVAGISIPAHRAMHIEPADALKEE